MKLVKFLLLLLLIPSTAFAQLSNVFDTTSALTITTTPSCIAANFARRALSFDATAAGDNIGYCEIASGASCTPVIGNSGTTTIVSKQLFYWPTGSAPRNGFCFIAASSSQALTVREGQ